MPVSLPGLDALIAGLDAVVSRELDATAEEAQRLARAAIHNVTGALGASIDISTPAPDTREVGTPLFYARFVENGRHGFTMQDKVLRFVANGRVVFARSVGPAAPRPFLGPLEAPLQAKLTANVNAGLSQVMGRA